MACVHEQAQHWEVFSYRTGKKGKILNFLRKKAKMFSLIDIQKTKALTATPGPAGQPGGSKAGRCSPLRGGRSCERAPRAASPQLQAFGGQPASPPTPKPSLWKHHPSRGISLLRHATCRRKPDFTRSAPASTCSAAWKKKKYPYL